MSANAVENEENDTALSLLSSQCERTLIENDDGQCEQAQDECEQAQEKARQCEPAQGEERTKNLQDEIILQLEKEEENIQENR